ncbi:MAG: hypothetical protein LH470_06510 [Lysobacter sp.]|nr:hypothetical protein [Lysobacter sp.]
MARTRIARAALPMRHPREGGKRHTTAKLVIQGLYRETILRQSQRLQKSSGGSGRRLLFARWHQAAYPMPERLLSSPFGRKMSRQRQLRAGE